MGEESIRKLNKIEGADVEWPVLEVSEYGYLDVQDSDATMTDAVMTDATMAEDLGALNTEMWGDYTEDDSNLTNVQCHDEDNNYALLSMIYHGCTSPTINEDSLPVLAHRKEVREES